MDVLEGNKLIAEFMGFKSTNGCVRHESGKYYDYHAMSNFSCIKEQEIYVESETGLGLVEQDFLFVSDLQFNSSWNWLMPCVEKIESMMYGVSNSAELWYDDEEDVVDKNRIQYVCIISDKYSRIVVNSANYFPERDSKITATWYAVVEFIKLHNK